MNHNNRTKITFLGAAGTVTGSKHLLEVNGKKILIDCGLFQGLKELRLLNWAKLPFDASEIDCVLLTHGHLDHVGYLPLLVKQGFRGQIFGTSPTLEIAKLVLLDSARINEEDAERANRFKFSKHTPALPLYNVKEAEAVFPLFVPENLQDWIPIAPEISFRYNYNGHIVGATFIELDINNKRWVFSGDIGREIDPLLRSPEKPLAADYLVIESTYGNCIHPQGAKESLARLINRASEKKGPVIIPGFAVERAQLLMYYVWQLKREGRIPPIPIYLDSPMGKSVLSIFKRFPEWHTLSESDCDQMMKETGIIRKYEDTIRLAKDRTPKIVIAASGMASGGRVLTYFENLLDKPNTTVMISGYQGEGTRGRALLDGAKALKIHGKFIEVKASVVLIEGLSAHADQKELLNWMGSLEEKPEKIFIVHGEKDGAEGLREAISKKYGYACELPALHQTYLIS